jgi:PEP-CTERM motif
MEKKFLVVSGLVLCVLFGARSSHADSIRLSDLRLDSPAGFSNPGTLDSLGASNFGGDDFSFRTVGSVEAPAYSVSFHERGEEDLSFTPDGAFGLPIASHLVRGFGTDGVASTSDDPGPTSVPEPASALLVGMGLLGLAVFARSNRNNSTLPPGSI